MKKRKIKITVFITGIIILIISSFMTVTYAEKIISLEGVIETEGVDVSIDSADFKKQIAPNMTVPYEPVITYRGIDAYLRFKILVSNENITMDNFSGLSDKWLKRGQYYYYTTPVKHNTELATFRKFYVPEYWTETSCEMGMESEFTITAMCDAVQADNFYPDFNSTNPWGEIIIEDNYYEGDVYKKTEESESAPIYLKTKGTSSYSFDSDSLCNKTFRPGDTYINDIIISNESKNRSELLFSTENTMGRDKYNLLDVIKLKMYIDDEEFYNGTLRTDELNNWKKLVVMNEGSTHKLHYEIEVPSELQNCYEVKKDSFIWNMKMHDIAGAPVTGDYAILLFWILLMIISLKIVICISRKKYKKDEQ